MSDVTVIGGTGHEGYGLALRWALAGKHITIGSREAERAKQAAQHIRDTAAGFGKTVEVDGHENPAAAAASPVVVVTVPLAAQIATIKSIKGHLRPNSLLVDATVPLATAIGGRASRMLGLPAGSAAEQLAEYAPAGVQVMSAFHFLSADLLAEVHSDGPVPIDCDIIACGGDAQAQEVLRDLASAIEGTHFVHAGPLVASRLVEAAATMLIAINIHHKVRNTGLRITGLND
jgi:NADPH-dependent F420 reductase